MKQDLIHMDRLGIAPVQVSVVAHLDARTAKYCTFTGAR